MAAGTTRRWSIDAGMMAFCWCMLSLPYAVISLLSHENEALIGPIPSFVEVVPTKRQASKSQQLNNPTTRRPSYRRRGVHNIYLPFEVLAGASFDDVCTTRRLHVVADAYHHNIRMRYYSDIII